MIKIVSFEMHCVKNTHANLKLYVFRCLQLYIRKEKLFSSSLYKTYFHCFFYVKPFFHSSFLFLQTLEASHVRLLWQFEIGVSLVFVGNDENEYTQIAFAIEKLSGECILEQTCTKVEEVKFTLYSK